MVKEQTAIPAVEDSGHVVGVEEEPVLLPPQVGERRVGAEVAVEARGLAERKVTLLGRVHHLRLVWKRWRIHSNFDGWILKQDFVVFSMQKETILVSQ